MPKLMFDGPSTRVLTNESLEYIADTAMSALAKIEFYLSNMVIGEVFLDGGYPYLKLMDTDYSPLYCFHGKSDRIHFNILEKALETGEMITLLGMKRP